MTDSTVTFPKEEEKSFVYQDKTHAFKDTKTILKNTIDLLKSKGFKDRLGAVRKGVDSGRYPMALQSRQRAYIPYPKDISDDFKSNGSIISSLTTLQQSMPAKHVIDTQGGTGGEKYYLKFFPHASKGLESSRVEDNKHNQRILRNSENFSMCSIEVDEATAKKFEGADYITDTSKLRKKVGNILLKDINANENEKGKLLESLDICNASTYKKIWNKDGKDYRYVPNRVGAGYISLTTTNKSENVTDEKGNENYLLGNGCSNHAVQFSGVLDAILRLEGKTRDLAINILLEKASLEDKDHNRISDLVLQVSDVSDAFISMNEPGIELDPNNPAIIRTIEQTRANVEILNEKAVVVVLDGLDIDDKDRLYKRITAEKDNTIKCRDNAKKCATLQDESGTKLKDLLEKDREAGYNLVSDSEVLKNAIAILGKELEKEMKDIEILNDSRKSLHNSQEKLKTIEGQEMYNATQEGTTKSINSLDQKIKESKEKKDQINNTKLVYTILCDDGKKLYTDNTVNLSNLVQSIDNEKLRDKIQKKFNSAKEIRTEFSLYKKYEHEKAYYKYASDEAILKADIAQMNIELNNSAKSLEKADKEDGDKALKIQENRTKLSNFIKSTEDALADIKEPMDQESLKDAHKKLNGFNKECSSGEDINLARHALKHFNKDNKIDSYFKDLVMNSKESGFGFTP